MCKRMISLLLVLLAVLTPAASAAGLGGFQSIGSYEEGQFRDVSAEDWYAEPVEAACRFGLMQGSSDGCFHPEASITLAEAVAMASRIHQIYHGGDGSFQQGEPWYQVYVDYALAHGLLDRAEHVQAPAARAEAARLLAAAVPAQEFNAINEVADGQIPDVAEDDAIYLLYRAGVLTGRDNTGAFGPETSICRAEAAAMAARVVDRSLRQRFHLEDPRIPQGSWSVRRGREYLYEVRIDGNVYQQATLLVETDEDEQVINSVLYYRTGTVRVDGGELVIDGECRILSSGAGEYRQEETFREDLSKFRQEGTYTYSSESAGIVEMVLENLEEGVLPGL